MRGFQSARQGFEAKFGACLLRTAFLVGAAAMTAAAAGLASASNLALLWAAAPAAGFAFGCHWSLMPSLASEVGVPSCASSSHALLRV